MPYIFKRGLEPADWFRLGCIALSLGLSVGIAALSMSPPEWWVWAGTTGLMFGLFVAVMVWVGI